jgi:hypothetical protein
MSEVILRFRAARAGELGLFPVDDEGADLWQRLKVNRDVGAEVKQRRNPRHHRLFFGMLKFVKEHCETFERASLDQIKDALKLATGLVDTFVDQRTGETYYVLKSISFAAMDQATFSQWFEAATDVIAERWMPAGTTPDDVRKELFRLVDGPQAIGERVA